MFYKGKEMEAEMKMESLGMGEGYIVELIPNEGALEEFKGFHREVRRSTQRLGRAVLTSFEL